MRLDSSSARSSSTKSHPSAGSPLGGVLTKLVVRRRLRRRGRLVEGGAVDELLPSLQGLAPPSAPQVPHHEVHVRDERGLRVVPGQVVRVHHAHERVTHEVLGVRLALGAGVSKSEHARVHRLVANLGERTE